jgi:uncharacterized membrane protein
VWIKFKRIKDLPNSHLYHLPPIYAVLWLIAMFCLATAVTVSVSTKTRDYPLVIGLVFFTAFVLVAVFLIYSVDTDDLKEKHDSYCEMQASVIAARVSAAISSKQAEANRHNTGNEGRVTSAAAALPRQQPQRTSRQQQRPVAYSAV